MTTFWIAFIIGCLISAIIPAVEGYCMAKYHRNRNPWLWFANCYLLGLFALMILICSPTLTIDEELGFQETDSLGNTLFLICIFLIFGSVILVWNFYSENQIIYNLF